MLKLGILGYPLEHSLSPIMHTAALQHLNIDGEYKAYEVEKEKLQDLFNKLKKEGINGLNVTIPHKKNIIPFLDELSENAKLTGSVNTLTFTDGKAIGDNTDLTGFLNSLPEDINRGLINQTTAVIGCGGSASAVSIALILKNVKSLSVYGRNENKLNIFCQFLDTKKREIKSKTKIQSGLIKDINLSGTDLLINTTPAGMYPNISKTPVPKNLLKQMSEESLVYDLIYNPKETQLLKDARSLGLKTRNGIDMLVNQGAESLNIWLGKNIAPVEIMKNSVL